MSLSRREFIQVLGLASVAGLALDSRRSFGSESLESLYRVTPFGNVHFLHMTDCHAQLNPVYYREPSVNIGVGGASGRVPHIVGDALLQEFNISPSSAAAHAFSCLNFNDAAIRYGRVGGFSHIKTLVDALRSTRPNALLLDGGDTWQGSGTALWTRGQDMVDASLLLGVDVMTAHWEMTLGAERVQHVVNHDFKGRVDFVAQNIRTVDFEDPVFDAFTMRQMNGVPVAIIGQAFPYTPIANPKHLIPDWTFGIREYELQQTVKKTLALGAKIVVLLSHNGMDVDLQLASRVEGIDAILGGHTHDGVPKPVIVANRSGKTLVTNAGSNGKFLGVLDFDYRNGAVRDFRYRLLPIFSNAIEPDRDMEALIQRVRRPYEHILSEPLAVTESLLYRRGNFNGSFDQLILDALMEEKDAEIAFSPGFRWGTSVLPHSVITMEHVLDQTATTYSHSTVRTMTGAEIKDVLEDVADNLFNADPYYQQGGDMVRVGGMTYSLDVSETIGHRVSNMRIGETLIDATKTYKVAGWASVSENASGEPIWDLLARWLRAKGTVSVSSVNMPSISGIDLSSGATSLCDDR